ncbi:MSHA biogenesis protein MshF [Vibrio sp. YIC-376]|uniref:MSHA biogenesis protein MshF n=1 Tax=Vibrio sp. YIC-376 TaxID=3136162 RepID=UPI00402A8645
MVENQNRARLILCGLGVILFLGLVIKSHSVTEEAQATGAKMAKVWMLDSVERYRHAWLVQGEPGFMEMDGFRLRMTEYGLVSPFTEQGKLDCAYWLAVHYPQHKIMASELSEVSGMNKSNHYVCQYRYKSGQKIAITSDANHLIVNVNLMTE